MRKISSFLIILCVTGFFFKPHLFAQQDPVVMKIGNEKITLSEFKYTYLKNNDLNTTSEADLREYIDLYINFRLRYAEALALRLDTIQGLQKELDGYRMQAARNYLTDKEVNDRLLDEVMERMQWDIRASHIMKRLPLEAKPKDTIKAYNEIMKIRDRLLKGESFEVLAVSESDDPSAKDEISPEGVPIRKGNKGDLGYFTVFNMIYSFESAAYNLKVGEISMPIRTEFGYHIVYIADKKPALGKCAVSQILISYPRNASAEDSMKTKEKVKTAYKAVKEGADFAQAVEMYSTDKGTIARKGEIPLFSVNNFEGDFIKHLYGLNSNDITEPFETKYGFYIVKLTNRIPVVINAETKAVAKNKILKDSRSNKSKEAFVERLKKEYKFKEFRNKDKFPALEEFYTIDSGVFIGQWTVEDSSVWQKPLFSVGSQTYIQKDFANYIEQNQYENVKNVNLDELINYMYKQYVQNTMIDYEDARLENKYPEFANLMKEYKEGVLLYELSEQKVWKKAETDTLGLKAFYEEIKGEYLYPVRVSAKVYTLKDETAYQKFMKLIKKGTSPADAMTKINKKMEVASVQHVIRWEGQDKNFDGMFNWLPWKPSMKKAEESGSFKVLQDYTIEEIRNASSSSSTFQFVEIQEFLAPSPKPLGEIKGMIVSLYQNYLEEEWIKSLRANNQVWVNEDVIMSLIKK
ncbi:MAG: peptidylprolyl isomerase [Bacteroidales bacterium]|jgi:peptidyl-prolyl cis-trans isomerase SurA|nr:peptidylprolyl isomerase [Bacteroidales bacterium]